MYLSDNTIWRPDLNFVASRKQNLKIEKHTCPESGYMRTLKYQKAQSNSACFALHIIVGISKWMAEKCFSFRGG